MRLSGFCGVLSAVVVLTGISHGRKNAPNANQLPTAITFVHVNVIPMDRERVLTDQTVVVEGVAFTRSVSSCSASMGREATELRRRRQSADLIIRLPLYNRGGQDFKTMEPRVPDPRFFAHFAEKPRVGISGQGRARKALTDHEFRRLHFSRATTSRDQRRL